MCSSVHSIVQCALAERITHQISFSILMLSCASPWFNWLAKELERKNLAEIGSATLQIESDTLLAVPKDKNMNRWLVSWLPSFCVNKLNGFMGRAHLLQSGNRQPALQNTHITCVNIVELLVISLQHCKQHMESKPNIFHKTREDRTIKTKTHIGMNKSASLTPVQGPSTVVCMIVT